MEIKGETNSTSEKKGNKTNKLLIVVIGSVKYVRVSKYDFRRQPKYF